MTERAIPASAAGSSHEPPPIGAATVSAFVRGFAALGFDVDALLASARVDPDVLRDPDSSIACSQFGAVIGAAYAERRMPNLALHLAAVIPIGAFPLLDYLILTCSTVGEGLQQLVRYMTISDALSSRSESRCRPGRWCHTTPPSCGALLPASLTPVRTCSRKTAGTSTSS